jgi:hypothetical protein
MLWTNNLQKQFKLIKALYKTLPKPPKWLRYKSILKNEYKLLKHNEL